MWRAFFLAVGITLCILGVECLIIERAVVASPAAIDSMRTYNTAAPVGKVIEPPDWAPWSLLSGGTIVILYSLSLKGGG